MVVWSAGARALCHETRLDAPPSTDESVVRVPHVLRALDARGKVPPYARRLSVLVPRPARPYQHAAAERASGRSGFIVAPCGAGKTLIGCLVAARNGGRTLVLTTRFVDQWVRTLHDFFAPCARVQTLDAVCGWPDVLVATYSGWRALSKDKEVLRHLPYDTVLLDEAHRAAAPTILALIDALSVRHVVALTATKVREDDALRALEARIGGTIVALDRAHLVRRGVVAAVRCVQLVVEYDARLEDRLALPHALALHPHKMQVLRTSLRQLCHLKHKTLVFCDDLRCLDWAVRMSTAPDLHLTGRITMHTEPAERRALVARFEAHDGPTVLFLSRTGDEALDLRSASAGLVFWNHWASRRQLVQRLGRLARVARDALFLVLLSDHPKEHEVAAHRDAYLRTHGFAVERLARADSEFGRDAVIHPTTERYDAAVVSHMASDHASSKSAAGSSSTYAASADR